jgi:hypothetical protein
MLRPPGPGTVPRPDGVEIVEVRDPSTLDAFTRTLADAFPVPEVQGLPYGGYGPGVLKIPGWRMWLATVDGEPVATSATHVGTGHVDIEWVSTRAEWRGRRIGEAITWAATLADPTKPAMLYASDAGQPVYERMGYLRLCRLTLWVGSRDPS